MPTLTDAQARVLQALQDGAALTMHARGDRGPYYTLNGRRLSMPLVKSLEANRWIEREGAGRGAASAYQLTAEGESALQAWAAPTPPTH
ncbi:hypothetical protein [Deinococcus maricopensis]|uniref:Uncharacterized protein n=1 Tax=Deinococcus maricopensis (strain DSM 21211 / LMG 22137 / NRRL B-23946 / LB-34) TaxID=709986 RepID=E8UA91_DEIML|nr:hypothetical protein [Deinococcus maricopensis]ADV67980.1 hypothetical protein Deima_2342 [Deinococcus maricopensis DSM 21211]